MSRGARAARIARIKPQGTRLRILGITDAYFPRVDGVSTAVHTLCRELRAKGHAVTLIAPDYGSDTDLPSEDVVRVSARRVLFDPENRMMKAQRVLELTERLRGWSYDLIHIHTPFVAHYLGVALARRLALPVVETYHTAFERDLQRYVPFLPKALTAWAARELTRSQCQAVDAVVVPSEAMRDVLYRAGVLTPISTVPIGVETSWFVKGDGAAFRERHGIAPERPLLVYIGRVTQEKNVPFLIDVLELVRRSHPDAMLVIAGEGSADTPLRQLVAERDLVQNVLFLGYLERSRELLDCYRAADVFAYPARTEMHALAVLEAMAAGVPVVAHALMGSKDVLQAGAGALIAEPTVEDFAAKVMELLQDPARRAELAAAGQEQARQWSASVMVERMLDCYREVTGQRTQEMRVVAG